MPQKPDRIPRYRRHKASGQAVVTLSGRDHYLGPYGTKTSRQEYDRLLAEWMAAGRTIRQLHRQPSLSIVELMAAYLRWAHGYYRGGSSELMHIKPRSN